MKIMVGKRTTKDRHTITITNTMSNYLMDYYIKWDKEIKPIRSLKVVTFDEDANGDNVVVFVNDKKQVCEAVVRYSDGKPV